ncbi:MAG: ABC transporter permease [Pseudomonadota bacterium]|nr:ABC transporter permease [Pseudomonadota bacterium]
MEHHRHRWQRLGFSNWLGLQTLYIKEVSRFFKVFGQTLIAPIVTTLLFLIVFSVAFGSNRMVNGIPYLEFLLPGLIMMTILQNSFANTSTSLIQQKLNESIIDVLLPPLSPTELTFGYMLGGATRGIIVAISVGVALFLIKPFGIFNIFFVIFYGFGAALMMSVIGIMTGIWADKFDHVSTVTNFIVLPLSFLSGTFFSINRFPELLQTVSLLNPFFYIIDGFRYGFTGYSDASIIVGSVVLFMTNVVLCSTCLLLFRSGYKLRA